MILQALDEYYKRKLSDPDSHTAPEGWEWKEIPFLIVIDQEGNFKAIEDTREGEGKKKQGRPFLVPLGGKTTSGISANLLWGNIEYTLGANPRGRTDAEDKRQAFFKKINEELKSCVDKPPLSCILKMQQKDIVKQIHDSSYAPLWDEIFNNKTKFLVSFKVEGTHHTIICDSLEKKAISNHNSTNEILSICLIRGENKPISRLHSSIKGVQGTKSTGGSIVSFDKSAFCSFGKTQGFNAPTSKEATFSYTTALNMLLSKNSLNKIHTGDTSAVFWSQKKTKENFDLEENFAWYVSDSPKDDPDRGVRAVKSLYDAMKSGHLPVFDENRFYILGLAPNAARIAIRFWRSGTVREFGTKILKHFDDIAIARGPNDPEHLNINRLLRATAFEYKMDNVPPNLSENLMTSILDGTPYPISLLHQCLRRVRAEMNVNYSRASIIKGYINRKGGNLSVALDRNNTNSGYLLGRLFAVLEKIQETANPGINSTIRDRFYGAASSSPVAVFPQLLRLKNHHLSKMSNKALKTVYEKEIGEIMNGIVNNLPSHLQLEGQAHFAIGYYQQRQAFFTKKIID